MTAVEGQTSISSTESPPRIRQFKRSILGGHDIGGAESGHSVTACPKYVVGRIVRQGKYTVFSNRLAKYVFAGRHPFLTT
jgi:hypothetical protein